MPARIFPDNSDWSPPLGPTEKDAFGTIDEDGNFTHEGLLDEEDNPEFDEHNRREVVQFLIDTGCDPKTANAIYTSNGFESPDPDTPEAIAYRKYLELPEPQ